MIGSNMGGIPELIDNNIDGYTYTRGDLKGFVQNVQYLISNPDLAIEMGKRAREKAERVYAPDPHYEKIKEIYRLAMSKNQT